MQTQTEGCVADLRSGVLYVGEEDRGIRALAPGATGSDGRLIADVEDLALLPQGRSGGWLIASGQGDNAYALFRLPDMAPADRFRVIAGEFGATEETDGIAVSSGSFGKLYRGGLFVAQDGSNPPGAQNFKLVSWRDVTQALRGKP